MKNNYIVFVAILVAVVFMILFGFSEYSNNMMRKQLNEREAYIDRIDTLLGLYSNVEFNDSSMLFQFPVDQYGNRLRFNDLDSLRKINEKIIKEQDAVIRAAKRVYKFDYSMKTKGDSLIIELWNK